ncbi:hypothetical protein BDU57DRAFT_558983 [Ampelomyces quisqualis]|uniref:Heterokaryon incompatibility domain-containing protein n=1 Tax=Ampelomyces quisqualis TaxID=50730 RepID=A0A6A5QCY8_AMPQU|nr:hypothetical protein BDU57DRAFT_558983 [Ampelomyces quisqualis]
MITRDPSLVGQMQAADSSLHVDVDMIAYPRKLFYFRYLVSKGQGGGSFLRFYSIKDRSPSFLDALVLSRDFQCTDPWDHIFALWDLAQDRDGLDFVPSYEKPYEEVYKDFTEAWIKQHGILDIIGAAEFPSPRSFAFYLEAPSWCPDWNTPATTSCLVRREAIPIMFMSALQDLTGKLYSADGDINQAAFDRPIFSFEGMFLCCTGIIIDRIDQIFKDAPDIPGSASKSHWRAIYWAQEMENLGFSTYEDPARAAWAMFHGDSIAAWPPIEETEAWTVVSRVLRGRRPFISEDGHMGLAPAYLAKPERGETTSMSIAVVAGCSVPLILQDLENGTYRLLGTCFVQGWMDGEWLNTMMGAESPKEFWHAMIDGAKLLISCSCD